MKRFLLALLLSTLALPLSANATKWTVDDVIMSEQAEGVRMSPNGDAVVWVKSVADKEKDGRVKNLMLTRLADPSKEITLTRGKDGATEPRWSPDGKLIAFLSSRPAPDAKDDDSETQIWLIDPNGGEPWPLTKVERGVNSFAWRSKGAIVFAAQEEPALYEKTIKEKKDKSIVVDDDTHEPPVRLYSVEVASKDVKRITANTDRISSFEVSPDGKYAITINDRSLSFEYDERTPAQSFLVDLSSGVSTRVFADSKYIVTGGRWSQDSRHFYATYLYAAHEPSFTEVSIPLLYDFDVTSKTAKPVDLGWNNGLADDITVTPDGFVALLANGVTNKFVRYTKNDGKWRHEDVSGTHADHIFGVQLSNDGHRIAYLFSTLNTPRQWYGATLDDTRLTGEKRVTHLNTSFDAKPKAKTEVVHWKGANGDTIEGLLQYPLDYKSGEKYPLVVMIHGGPAGADMDYWSDRMSYPSVLYTQKNAFVFHPNYHGSSNYGIAWLESIGQGKYYDLEVPDIEKGVDALIARGLVDPQKLGVLGWSNGGILTTALTVTTTRYKAASSGAGDVEWVSDWGNCQFGASFDNYYFGKSPIEDPQLYRDKSPFFKLDRVTTPTLIFFGTEDRQVPTQQGWMHFRALQQLGKAPVRFVLFPGEKHGPVKLTHQRRKVEEELAWFDKYLFNDADQKNEAIKPGSPLATALAMKNAPRENGRYGRVANGVLVPDVVAHDGISVARFEITRAQYAAFDPSFTVEAGRENYPATGVTFDQAKKYATWLSAKTGEKYRLPNAEEAEKLYGSGDGENTLDYWAGYAVNPDDAARLAKSISDLGDGSLLRAVGSFRGNGDEDPVFDLGGNVAEWTIAKNGDGVISGGSADQPSDDTAGVRKPAPAYVGFRVVRQ